MKSLSFPLRDLGRALARDERGFVLSAELVLILTLGVLAMVVGINAVAKSINNELSDVAAAFGTFNQSFWTTGFVNWHGNAGVAPRGFGFVDLADECDCAPIIASGGNAKWGTGGFGARYAVPGYGGGVVGGGAVGGTVVAPAAPACPGGCPQAVPAVPACPCPAGVTDCPCGPAAEGVRPLGFRAGFRDKTA